MRGFAGGHGRPASLFFVLPTLLLVLVALLLLLLLLIAPAFLVLLRVLIALLCHVRSPGAAGGMPRSAHAVQQQVKGAWPFSHNGVNSPAYVPQNGATPCATTRICGR
jgi:hypothetical protein